MTDLGVTYCESGRRPEFSLLKASLVAAVRLSFRNYKLKLPLFVFVEDSKFLENRWDGEKG
jgi:hypothetical protein